MGPDVSPYIQDYVADLTDVTLAGLSQKLRKSWEKLKKSWQKFGEKKFKKIWKQSWQKVKKKSWKKVFKQVGKSLKKSLKKVEQKF